MPKKKKAQVPRHELFAVAAASQSDPRTVQRVIDGKPTRSVVRGRIEAALKARGL